MFYENAKDRAEKSKAFFKDVMKLDSVEICEDYSRDDIVKKFAEIQKESDEFEAAHKDNHQAIFGVYIAWVGYYVSLANFDELD